MPTTGDQSRDILPCACGNAQAIFLVFQLLPYGTKHKFLLRLSSLFILVAYIEKNKY